MAGFWNGIFASVVVSGIEDDVGALMPEFTEAVAAEAITDAAAALAANVAAP